MDGRQDASFEGCARTSSLKSSIVLSSWTFQRPGVGDSTEGASMICGPELLNAWSGNLSPHLFSPRRNNQAIREELFGVYSHKSIPMDEFGVKAFSSGLAVPGNLSRFLLLALQRVFWHPPAGSFPPSLAGHILRS